ncbi:MAG: CDP-glucose 4,6-dehydratase [Pseudomonadota bacterium]
MSSIRLPSGHFWKDRTVAITGHMGFKGAWLCALLARLGAHTSGYGKDDRTPLLYPDLALPSHNSHLGDINTLPAVRDWLQTAQPEFLLHLAAQPIVLTSYDDPMGTFRDNIMGTAAVLQAARDIPSLKAIIVVTSDKVYRNTDDGQAFREGDHLGGKDPYSASKAAAEIVTSAMADSFYKDPASARVVTVRAGNVIGGGDWAAQRLLPDAARAFLAGEPLIIRSPQATRPWQHVLDPLAGYLALCETLDAGDALFREWNFGPDAKDSRPVADVIQCFTAAWGGDAEWKVESLQPEKQEARMLSVDSSRARTALDWLPRWQVDEAVRRTAAWYRDYAAGSDPSGLVSRDLDAFLKIPDAS